ncbi:hypothetical protein GCM10007928_48960 [Sulfitobacter porphyrae]|nr:hypothetical protein GCM10007928_48960 [Sulfitobacter porphyrae]
MVARHGPTAFTIVGDCPYRPIADLQARPGPHGDVVEKRTFEPRAVFALQWMSAIVVLRDLSEKIGQNRRVADVAPGDLDSADLRRFFVDPKVELAPCEP